MPAADGGFHAAILDAPRAGDADTAAEAVRGHIGRVGSPVRGPGR